MITKKHSQSQTQPPAPATPAAPAQTVPSFEQALEQLETIVESMESGDIPLANLIEKFEQGTNLLKTCETRLKEAEIKIEMLKKQKDGAPAFTEFPVGALRANEE